MGLSLQGMDTNRLALGARIKIVLESGFVVHRTVSSGGSFGGNPLDQMIGLGKDGKIKTINIFWPGSQTTQTFSGIDSDGWYRVIENESILINK